MPPVARKGSSRDVDRFGVKNTGSARSVTAMVASARALGGTLHRAQFVIDAVARPAGEDWRTRRLDGGLILAHCLNLTIAEHAMQDGRTALLLGYAHEADPTAAPVAAAIAASDLAGLFEQTYGWCGRWLLIAGGEILPDASGLLGLFYHADGGGGLAASSSLALLHAARPRLRAVPRHPVNPPMDGRVASRLMRLRRARARAAGEAMNLLRSR